MLQDVLNRSYKEGCLNPDSKRKSRGNLSRKTLQGIRGVEVAFVKWARQHKYTALRPEDEDLTVPKGARLKGRKILQPDSLRVLLSTDTRVVRGKVEQDENVHAYRIAVMTGLRPGELLGLRVGDLDGDRVHIGRAINRQNEETSGKNENAIRTVVLHLWLWPRSAPDAAAHAGRGTPLAMMTRCFCCPTSKACTTTGSSTSVATASTRRSACMSCGTPL